MKLNILKSQIFILSLLFVVPFFAMADNTGDKTSFFVEQGFTPNNKSQVSATLIKSPDRLYFYVESDWWNSKTEKEKETINAVMESLGTEFNTNIYSKLTTTFGTEATPGVDKDRRITVLFYQAKDNVKGYVRNIDEYEKTVNPLSNQREMIYINASLFTGQFLKETLAHEFTHLITVNQKELRTGTSEDVWLNEARAEYAVTLMGYNDIENSYLKSRLGSFLEKPYDSLTEWSNSSYDYGVINSFIHYLVDQYGLVILTDSLKSDQKGIDSINEALLKNGHKETFSDIFSDWTIATYVNDCSIGARYCFKDKNLINLHVVPFGNFLPFSGESTLYLGQSLSNYSSHWQKFSGGKGDLKIKLSNPSGVIKKIPYVVKSVSGETTIGFMKLDKNSESELIISNIGKDIYSVTIIPSVGDSDIKELDGKTYFYSITANTYAKDVQIETDNGIKLPFTIDKPLSQMNREELLMVLLKVVIYLMSQGRTIF
jgi:hypothetical protein